MKKLMVVFSIMGTLCTSSMYAQSLAPSAVLNAFHSYFTTAAHDSWSTVKGLYRVDFNLENEKVTAFFNADAELIAASRNVSLLQLPLALKSDLTKNFNSYKVSSLFEVDKEDGVYYYATVNNNKNQLVLESTPSGGWVKKF